MARHKIPIVGACITLSMPNDTATLNRISLQLPFPNSIEENWSSFKIGKLTINEWVYLGALVLAMMNVAALFFGLIDGYTNEIYVLRRIGIQRTAVYRAIFWIIFILSAIGFAGAALIFHIIQPLQKNLLSDLPVTYILFLFALFIGAGELMSIIHTRSILRGLRKKAANL